MESLWFILWANIQFLSYGFSLSSRRKSSIFGKMFTHLESLKLYFFFLFVWYIYWHPLNLNSLKIGEFTFSLEHPLSYTFNFWKFAAIETLKKSEFRKKGFILNLLNLSDYFANHVIKIILLATLLLWTTYFRAPLKVSKPLVFSNVKG